MNYYTEEQREKIFVILYEVEKGKISAGEAESRIYGIRPAMVDDGWISFKEKPDKSSRENPIWIASIKNKNVTLGYYDFNYGWFDMNGNGLSCSHWKYPTKPELPPYLTLPNNNQP